MSASSLVFSEKRSDRIKRHFVFWFFWFLYFGFLHAVNPFGKPEISYLKNLPFTITESLLFLPPQMLLTYYMLYFVLPKYMLKNRYLQGFLCTIPIWFLSAVINLYMVREINPAVMSYLLPEKYLVNTQRPPAVQFMMALFSTFKGGLTIAAIAVGLKFIKHWYLKEQRNLQLQKENTHAQLQLLTAQVHPHFLFNTLNNIYSQSQTESPKSSKMIMGLSDLLRYILYEGQKPLVPLNQELLMIKEYINLEQIRYGNKLDVHVLTPAKTDDIYIAPLLLLPFVENCFKHGASKILKNPWISFTVDLRDTTLVMKLLNGKTVSNPKQQSGIAINNVRKRLELLYHDNYDLQIRDEEEVFVVDLTVKLVRFESQEKVNELNETIQKLAYA
jgi:sensor histidine kinase YesM